MKEWFRLQDIILRSKTLKISLKHKDGISYGDVGGYMTTIRSSNDAAELFVGFYIPDAQVCEKIEKAAQEIVEQNKYGIFDYEMLNNSLLFKFPGGKDARDNINAFVSYFYPLMQGCGALGTDYCPVCKRRLHRSDSTEKFINGNAYLIHNNCAVKLGLEAARPVDTELPELRKNPVDTYDSVKEDDDDNINYKTIIMGAIGAVLGGLIGALLWSVVFIFGWPVAIVGFIICLLVIKGYALFGGDFSLVTIPIVFVSVILSVFWGQILAKDILITETYFLKAIHAAPSFKQVPGIIIDFLSSSAMDEQMKSLFGLGVLLAVFAALMFLNAANHNKNKL